MRACGRSARFPGRVVHTPATIQRSLLPGNEAKIIFAVVSQEISTEGRVPVQRLQRRLLHTLCQRAEQHLQTKLVDSIPVPSRHDEFHPAKTHLGVNFNVFFSHENATQGRQEAETRT